MAIDIRHKFQSQISDGDDTDLVRPSNWNDNHELKLNSDKLIGRAGEGVGPAEEIACTEAARSFLAAVDAAAQRLVLKLGSAAILNEASAAEFIAATASRLLSPQSVWNAAPPVALTYSSPLVLDLAAGLNFEVTLAGSPQLGTPQNAKAGQTGCLVINTGAAGRTISYSSVWVAAGGPQDISDIDTTDYLFFWVRSPSLIVYSMVLDPT